jgi:FkbM family methyltransferase
MPGKIELLRSYLHECLLLYKQHRRHFSLESLCRWYPVWERSLQGEANSLADRRPWITFDAALPVERLVNRGSRVFEYGCGGSTLFFADRVGELFSVEHDPDWLTRVQKEMHGRTDVSWTSYLAPPSPRPVPSTFPPSDPDAYATTDMRYSDFSFREYAASIDVHEDNSFDLVLIDGRARPSCFKHALHKVKFGGTIVLDNAERPQYCYVEELARAFGFEIEEFWGPGPYNLYFWRTLLLRKVQRYFSLNDLDRKLEQYLNFDGGIFVEAGANDGVRQSNTLHFEACRSWRGLLVEPVPALARQCRLHRPRSIVETVALVAPKEAGKHVTLRYAGLMSVIKGGMKTQEEEQKHIEAAIKVQQITESFELEVPGTTLSTLLDKHGIEEVHLLSLDLEGYELEALKGLDFARHRPHFILVEARYRDDIERFLAPFYKLEDELSHHDLLFRCRQGLTDRSV